MTIEEKRLRIIKMCDSHNPRCTDNGICPLYGKMERGCAVKGSKDSDIEEAYRIAFGEE